MPNIVMIPEPYAFEGVLLLLIAVAALLSMLTIKRRARATLLLILFFVCMASLGFSRILGGIFGGFAFPMLQDFFIGLGGLFLVQFIYRYPRADQPAEAKFVLAIYLALSLSALSIIMFQGVSAIQGDEPALQAPRIFWFFMPLSIVCAALLCLRRALHCSAGHYRTGVGVAQYSVAKLKVLISPPTEPSVALRNLSFAISLGVIQAMPALVQMPGNLGHYMTGIGGFLVVAGIALVYYSHSLEPISFAARLVGVFLTVLLFFSGATGINSILEVRDRQQAIVEAHFQSIQLATENTVAISLHGDLQPLYVVSWHGTPDADFPVMQVHYLEENTPADILDGLPGSGGEEADLNPGAAASFFRGNTSGLYRVRFSRHGDIYEAGVPWSPYAKPILAEIRKQINFVVISTIAVLLFFPIFFRRHLFGPLNSLLIGVKQADQGDYQLQVPIWFEDEIGAITRSFNKLTTSLEVSNKEREEYHQQLLAANVDMERRVEERTVELSAMNRQLLLAEDDAKRTAKLEERQRLARDLHDAITQSLYGVMLFARASRDSQEVGDEPKLIQNLVEVERNALQTLKEMRLLLHQLRPMSVESNGLRSAVNSRFDQVERRLDIAASVEMDAEFKLPSDVEDSVFLLASEALNNSLKHANASTVLVRLICEGSNMVMEVKDDGEGFDPLLPTSGMGLRNMKERATILGGELEIQTGIGQGTLIRMTLPQEIH